MSRLDRTGQRLIGVLIEKELSVPDIYPMSENALLDGCNQKSNREPVMELVGFQITGALMALQEQGWVARIDGGGRVTKYRHKAVDRLHLDRAQLAIVAELLVRGAQAPGALKPRLSRMGVHLEPEAIESQLRQLAGRNPALVEQLQLGPRERERRWRHLLGDGSEQVAAPETSESAAPLARSSARSDDGGLEARVATLEQQVAAMQRQLDQITQGRDGD